MGWANNSSIKSLPSGTRVVNRHQLRFSCDKSGASAWEVLIMDVSQILAVADVRDYHFLKMTNTAAIIMAKPAR